MTSEQELFWQGQFGSEYSSRCKPDWSLRVPFWEEILLQTGARSVLEVGCNIGSNMKAARSVDRQIDLVGVDVNPDALMEATLAGLNVHEMSGAVVGHRWPDEFDLVATVGVLIHVAPEHLSDMMDSIIMASRKYVLAVEYAADTEEHVDYRGHSERLWRRPFGDLYQAKGLKLIEERDAGNGFDKCTAWLLSKSDA